jgi:hypothetical protein
VTNSTVCCSSRTEATGADLGGVGAGVGEQGTTGVGERGVADGAGRGLGGVGGGGLAEAIDDPGAEVDELGEDELLAPLAPSKWT